MKFADLVITQTNMLPPIRASLYYIRARVQYAIYNPPLTVAQQIRRQRHAQ